MVRQESLDLLESEFAEAPIGFLPFKKFEMAFPPSTRPHAAYVGNVLYPNLVVLLKLAYLDFSAGLIL